MANLSKLTILCTVILLTACSNGHTPEERRTVLCGRVVNRTAADPKVITWNFCDPFFDGRTGQRIAEDGSFRFETDGLIGLHNTTINYGRFINFFAAPGDSIRIVIDAAKLNTGAADAVRFGGDRADLNDELAAHYNRVCDLPYADPAWNPNATPEEMVREIEARMNRYEDSLKRFSLSPQIADFMRRDLLFILANDLLDYSPNDPGLRKELFGDPIFGIHDTENLRTMMFPYHLTAYSDAVLSTDTAYTAARLRNDFGSALRNGIRILKETEPATACRDVMMWKLISRILETTPPACDSVPETQTAFTDPLLNERMAAMIRSKDEATVLPDTPIDGIVYLKKDGTTETVPETDVFAYLRTRYPGKVLYIDVWATWCGPCMTEMEHAPQLHEIMRNREVVFVNLCLGSDREAWLRKITEKKIAGENYWFDRDATDLFLIASGASGYPTYILTGRDGRIVTLHARRPSALTRTVQQIDGLLTE